MTTRELTLIVEDGAPPERGCRNAWTEAPFAFLIGGGLWRMPHTGKGVAGRS